MSEENKSKQWYESENMDELCAARRNRLSLSFLREVNQVIDNHNFFGKSVFI